MQGVLKENDKVNEFCFLNSFEKKNETKNKLSYERLELSTYFGYTRHI